MGENSMYWPDQSGWYQQPGPQNPPPPPYQSSNYHSSNSLPNEHASPTPPSQTLHNQQQQQQMMPNGAQNGNHINHMQSSLPPHAGPTQSSHAPATVNHYGPQQGASLHHEPPPQSQQQQQPPQQMSAPQHQSIDASPGYPMQHAGYQQPSHQHPAQSQMYAQNNSANNTSYTQPSSNQSSVQNPHHAGSNHAQANMSSMQQASQHQHHHQQASVYPQQQYSPAPYWSSGPPQMHNQHQTAYGPPPGAAQGPSPALHQGPTPTPPSSITDNSTGYHTNNGQPPPAQIAMAPQQPQQPPPSNLPYDSRGSNIATNYNGPYQQPAPGYYSPHEVQHTLPPPPPPQQSQTDPYESHPTMSQHPQQQGPPSNVQSNWSNGYYQPSQSPYSMNPYPTVPPYNGTSSNMPPSHLQQNPVPPHPHMQGPPPNHHQPPPPAQHHQPHMLHHQHPPLTHHTNGPPPQYPGHPPPPNHHQAHHQQHITQSQQQWPMPPPHQQQQNHIIPIIERNNKSAQEKKPVKPRAPRKQPNPNAPAGRRKRPFMTEEHKQSGYAKFYQVKRKELKTVDFGQISKIIADLWAKLSVEERSTYAKDVSIKRKEMLKKKASQQAQDLLVQGMTNEHDVLSKE